MYDPQLYREARVLLAKLVITCARVDLIRYGNPEQAPGGIEMDLVMDGLIREGWQTVGECGSAIEKQESPDHVRLVMARMQEQIAKFGPEMKEMLSWIAPGY